MDSASPELVGRAVAAAAVVLVSIAVAGARPAASGAAPSGAAQARLLARSRALWSAQHLESYHFRLRISCDCAASGRPLEIVVRRGRPHGSRYFVGQLQTFPEMFRLIGQVLADPASEGATVRYDPRRGFPRLARVDSITWRVDRFAAG